MKQQRPKLINVLSLALCLMSAIGISSCFKDFKTDFQFTEFMVEFDAASWQSPTPGKTYPVLGPLEKGSGLQSYKVNLLGRQRNTSTQVKYRIVADETTAEEGKHFALADGGTFVIGANSSTGEIGIEILDFPAESGTHLLVLELVETEDVKVSENYKKIGISISLVGPPSQGYLLHAQLGPSNYYNSIYFDQKNPAMPADLRARIEQSAANLAAYADGTRRLHSLYLYFDEGNKATVVAQYYGGGGAALTNGAVAAWTYDLQLDEQGVGRFQFFEANSNGNAQKSNFAPILSDFLEKYEFKVDWVDPAIAAPPRPGKQLGGLFRTDNPSSFLPGTLETLNAAGSVRPYQQSPKLHEIFDDGEGGYYSTILINPEDGAQSPAFVSRWESGKSYIEGLAGRKLHRMMLYFNPDFNFQDVQLITYYYSSAGGKFLGQLRFVFHADFDGVADPFQFFLQNGNGSATRAPSIVDNLLMTQSFRMTRSGSKVRFTDVNDPSLYFEGVLGKNPLSVTQFWPD